MKGIIGGLGVIAIGLLLNDSVFLGQFTTRAIIFDALGLFFIIRGLISIYRAKQTESITSASSPPPPAPLPPRR